MTAPTPRPPILGARAAAPTRRAPRPAVLGLPHPPSSDASAPDGARPAPANGPSPVRDGAARPGTPITPIRHPTAHGTPPEPADEAPRGAADPNAPGARAWAGASLPVTDGGAPSPADAEPGGARVAAPGPARPERSSGRRAGAVDGRSPAPTHVHAQGVTELSSRVSWPVASGTSPVAAHSTPPSPAAPEPGAHQDEARPGPAAPSAHGTPQEAAPSGRRSGAPHGTPSGAARSGAPAGPWVSTTATGAPTPSGAGGGATPHTATGAATPNPSGTTAAQGVPADPTGAKRRAPVLRGGRPREAVAEFPGTRAAGVRATFGTAGSGGPTAHGTRAATEARAGAGNSTGPSGVQATFSGRTAAPTTGSGATAAPTAHSGGPTAHGTRAATEARAGAGNSTGPSGVQATFSGRTAAPTAHSGGPTAHGTRGATGAGAGAGGGAGQGAYASGPGGEAGAGPGAGHWGPRGGPGAWGAAALVGGDCAAALAGVVVAGRGLGTAGAAVLVAALLAAHRRGGLYRPALLPSALAELPALAGRAAAAWCLAAAVTAADGSGVLGWAPLLAAVAVTASAACLLRALVHARRRAAVRRAPAPTLVVGGGPDAERLVTVLRAHPEYGLRPVTVVPPGSDGAAPPRPRTASAAPAPRVPLPATGAGGRHAVRHVLVLAAGGPAADSTAALLAGRGCRVWQVAMDGTAAAPGHGGAHAGAPPAGHLWGFTCTPVPARRTAAAMTPGAAFGAAYGMRAPRAKRAMDAGLAGLALLMLAPVLGACALAVRLADGPGVLFHQERIGLGGRPFTLLKFRTLRPGDARESATRWSIAGDHRMSAVGRVLRRTSLDELPQLWNVLRGDMSMVGPRPERPYFVERFSAEHPGYADRHRMPAGITGLAQVHGLRGDTSIADRARFDNHYIDTWSLWQDVTILVRTACTVFRFGGS